MKIQIAETKRILEMHKKHYKKGLLMEQLEELRAELQRFLDTGCITDGEIVDIPSAKNPKYQLAIRKESKQTKGKYRYFYADYSCVEFVNKKPVKLPNWRCDEKKMKEELENFKKTGKGGGWMEYKDAKLSNTIDWNNKDTYETEVFNGIYLYRAKTRAGQVALTKDQLAYVQPYIDKGWLLPSDQRLEGPDKDLYVATVVPGSKKAFGGEGITMYMPEEDIKILKSKVVSQAGDAIAARSFSKKDCKNFISSYWEMYKVDGSNPKRQPEERLKTATQMCIRQHYGDYYAFGEKFDKIMDVLTGRLSDYEGFTAPVTKSPWRLLPKGYQ